MKCPLAFNFDYAKDAAISRLERVQEEESGNPETRSATIVLQWPLTIEVHDDSTGRDSSDCKNQTRKMSIDGPEDSREGVSDEDLTHGSTAEVVTSMEESSMPAGHTRTEQSSKDDERSTSQQQHKDDILAFLKDPLLKTIQQSTCTHANQTNKVVTPPKDEEPSVKGGFVAVSTDPVQNNDAEPTNNPTTNEEAVCAPPEQINNGEDSQDSEALEEVVDLGSNDANLSSTSTPSDNPTIQPELTTWREFAEDEASSPIEQQEQYPSSDRSNSFDTGDQCHPEETPPAEDPAGGEEESENSSNIFFVRLIEDSLEIEPLDPCFDVDSPHSNATVMIGHEEQCSDSDDVMNALEEEMGWKVTDSSHVQSAETEKIDGISEAKEPLGCLVSFDPDTMRAKSDDEEKTEGIPKAKESLGCRVSFGTEVVRPKDNEEPQDETVELSDHVENDVSEKEIPGRVLGKAIQNSEKIKKKRDYSEERPIRKKTKKRKRKHKSKRGSRHRKHVNSHENNIEDVENGGKPKRTKAVEEADDRDLITKKLEPPPTQKNICGPSSKTHSASFLEKNTSQYTSNIYSREQVAPSFTKKTNEVQEHTKSGDRVHSTIGAQEFGVSAAFDQTPNRSDKARSVEPEATYRKRPKSIQAVPLAQPRQIESQQQKDGDAWSSLKKNAVASTSIKDRMRTYSAPKQAELLEAFSKANKPQARGRGNLENPTEMTVDPAMAMRSHLSSRQQSLDYLGGPSSRRVEYGDKKIGQLQYNESVQSHMTKPDREARLDLSSSVPHHPQALKAIPSGVLGSDVDIGDRRHAITTGGFHVAHSNVDLEASVAHRHSSDQGTETRDCLTLPQIDVKEIGAIHRDRTDSPGYCDLPTVRILCSESFLDIYGDLVAELGSGQWSALNHDAENVAGERHGPASGRKIELIDTALVDQRSVDIELPGRCAMVVYSASAIEDESDAKKVILEFAKLVAAGTYKRLYVFIYCDVDITESVAMHIAKLQAASICNGSTLRTSTYFKTTSPLSLSSSVATTIFSCHKQNGSRINSDKLAKSVQDQLVNQRVAFLMSVSPSLSALGALQCIHFVHQKCGYENGFVHLFQNQLFREQMHAAASGNAHELAEVNLEAFRQLSAIIHAPFVTVDSEDQDSFYAPIPAAVHLDSMKGDGGPF